MLLTEYNEAEAMKLFELDGIRKGRAEGRAEGRVEGRAEGRAEGRVEGRAEGRVEGRAEGENNFAELISKLYAAGRETEIQKAAEDKAYRAALFKEFQIN